ncbi:MAG: multi-sensor hybrid histidine kinase [Betaproteobacteria bacterium]|nr:multi-sensor hybrid histidine kinase [Betaproteobacteria bacterium]
MNSNPVAARGTRTALLESQRRVLERIASAAPLAQTLETLVRLIEEQAVGMRCAVLLADSVQQSLTFIAAPHIPEEYKTGIRPFLRIAPDMGSCGTAAFLREPVYTQDTATDPRWKDCADIAVRNGLRAIWSTPVLADDNSVLGTFAMYYGEPRLPSPEHIELIDMAVQMARVAIDAKQSEEALRRGEDRLRIVIDTIPTMAWSVLPGGAVDFVNKQWLEYTGFSFEEGLHQSDHAVHPDDLPNVIEKWTVDMAAGGACEYELRLRRADGEYHSFLVRTVPLRDEQGNIVKWYGTAVDIEDRKRVEDALRLSEDRLRHVIDSIPAIVWSASPDGAVDFVNDRSLQYTGLSKDDSMGSRWTSVIHPDDIPATTDHWGATLRSGQPAEIEHRLRRHDGQFRWFLCRHVPVRDSAGNIVRWYGICADIEDRRQAEQALRRNQSFLIAEAQHIGGLLKLELSGGPRVDDLVDKSALADRHAHDLGLPAVVAGEIQNPDEGAPVAERRAIASLTANERSIFSLIAAGKSNTQMAKVLHLSPRTVETYRSRLMHKLQLDDIVALVKLAIRHKLTPLN